MSITLTGTDSLVWNMLKLAKSPDDATTEKNLLGAAEKLRDRIKENAPKGPTGNLEKGIVAKVFQHKRAGAPAVFVGIDYGIAPHAHLVEFGTVKAAAHPFFRPQVDAFDVEAELAPVAEKMIEEAL